MLKSLVLGTFCFIFACASLAQTLPPEDVRTAAFTEMVETMTRLDGEALFVRANRPTTWIQQTKSLLKEAREASSIFELLRTFYRLDASYPNLHSKVQPGPRYSNLIPKRIRPQIRFLSEWYAENHSRYVIMNTVPGKDVHIGDEVIAINGRLMRDWEEENFEFCKLPLKAQCNANLNDAFQKELLSWNRSIPLSYTIKRGEKVWTIAVDLEDYTPTPPSLKDIYCKHSPNRYSGFDLVYSGNRACVYQSKTDPKVALLRITSFAYPRDFLENGETLTSVDKEVDALYPWWSQNANWDHLVIDVIDNHGGEAPIAYYQILLQKDFQEQYVTFIKTPEMEDPKIRESLFWGEKAQEIWFRNLVSSGVWGSLNYGDKTPHVPMFCADSNRDCSQGLFPVRPHPFVGKVSVLVSEWCVSSCDGFVYTMRDEFRSRARFFGLPQAADSAYSRLQINLEFDSTLPRGYKIEVAPLYAPIQNSTFVSQVIVYTQSTTASGEIVSGIPVTIDGFVPRTLQNFSRWPEAVLGEALRKSWPVAPQPVAPQPVAPQPVAPQPVAPQPVAP
ncbi:MAG: hypothetical protein AB7H97_04400, partial [Pseudobdellovibrionaceae bacterium]